MKLKSVLKVALALVAICSLFVACDTLAGGRFPLSGETNWYYIDIPLDTPNIIFNDGKVQTADITGIDVSEGSVYYEWDATVDKIMPVVYDSSKKPEGKAGRVWVYTNSTKTPNCYWWGSVEGENPDWPGVKMSTENGVEKKVEVVIKGYKFINVPEAYEGKTIYAHGEILGGAAQPGNEWGDTTPHKAVVENGKATIEFADEHVWKIDGDVKIQVIAKHWDDKICEGAETADFEKCEEGEEYYITIDCAKNKAAILGFSITVKGYKFINVPAQYEGKTIYAHGELGGAAQPGNEWNDTTPHKATVENGKATIEFAEANIWEVNGNVKIQVIAKHWDDKICGGVETANFDDCEAGKEFYVTIDCTANANAASFTE